MSNQFKIAFLMTMILSLPGCGKESGKNQSEKNQVPPKSPKVGEDNIDGKLCYPFAGTGACYTLQAIDEINQAERMYVYPDPESRGFDPVQYRTPINLFYVPEVEGGTKIAENFARQEVVWANSTRGHYGYFSPFAIQKIQELRNYFGRPLKITSGYRSPGYNASIPGAAEFSRHQYGDAIDFRIAGVDFDEIRRVCREILGARFTQKYTNHVHCDWGNDPLDERVYGEVTGPIRLQSHAELIHQLETHTHINFNKLQDEDLIQFQVETISQDGPGLAHEWEFYKENVLIASSEEELPQLRLDPGQYEVYVKVGGNIEIMDEIQVN